METVSQRLADTTDRLDNLVDKANIDIAVQRERLDNHDEALQGIQAAIQQHQTDDRNAHKEMNAKLDDIKSSVDKMSVGKAIANVEKSATSIWVRASDIIGKWRYAFIGGMFVAGALTHKAHFFEWLIKFFVDNGG